MIDVVVAGGGPVGLVTAVHAARAGLRTVVLEPRAAPIDKACGEGLMPAAVAALAELGVRPTGMPISGIRYLAGGRTAVADLPGGGGLGVRRTALHRALHDAAVAAGVDIRIGRVDGIRQDEDGVEAAGIRARFLVGADGLHSQVRGNVDPGPVPGDDALRRWGIRAHFATAPWTRRVEVYWAEDAEAYVTPVGADCVGVAVLGPRGAGFDDRLVRFPELAARLPREPIAPARAAGPMRQRARRHVAGRALLVGDAAGYVDALTGEGLAIGFACADAAVRRIVAGEPSRYEQDYARLTRRYRALTTALLWAGRRPALRRRIVPAADRLPWLFDRAVASLGG